MVNSATHLRLLPTPTANIGPTQPGEFSVLTPHVSAYAAGNAARRFIDADESGDEVALAAARAEFRRLASVARELRQRPVDFAPYRPGRTHDGPPPLLVVVQPDRAAYTALVRAEGLARDRVKRAATYPAALRMELNTIMTGRSVMVISQEVAS